MTNTTFSQLSLSPELLAAVTEMGFTETTDVQAEAIPVIRAGADVLARSQTGTGKTVAFGIPAVECVQEDSRHVQVLVLSPTRELAHQCGDEIRKLAKYLPHVKAADILGGADYRGQFKDLQAANLVVGTPGRIMDHMERGSLDLSHLKMIVLDEADEMLNMGFREDIEVILRDAPAQRQIVLFSATVPDEIMTIAEQFQHDPVQIMINREQVTLENICQVYADVPLRRKPEALALLLHYYAPRRAIIFANTKSMVDELTETLSAGGFSVEGLHGDMKQLQRTTVMNAFKQGRINLLVATDVAARGIDVSDIDYVFNFDIPKVADYYVHRIGRTGRAGRAGTAVTLCSGRQQLLQLQRLASRVKSDISLIPLPTVEAIETQGQARMLETIEAALAAPSLPIHDEMIAQLAERGHDPQRIAATLLGFCFHQDTRKLSNLPVPAGRKSGEGAQRAYVREHRAKALLAIDIGSANRVTPKHIIGAVTERAGISSLDLGKVEITESYSTLAVPADAAKEIALAMQGCKICGKPVHVMPMPVQAPRRKDPKTAPRSPKSRAKRPAGKLAKPWKK